MNVQIKMWQPPKGKWYDNENVVRDALCKHFGHQFPKSEPIQIRKTEDSVYATIGKQHEVRIGDL